MPQARPSWTLALALCAGAWLLLSWPWLSGAVTIPWDAKAHFYPQLQFLAQSLHRGEWPFWAPYVFSGTPQIADPQSLLTSPPFITLSALSPNPGFQAFDGVVLASLGVGGAFFLLFFKDRGWHPAGALVAAIAFAFGVSAAWRVQHVGQVMSLALWPVALVCLTRALDRSSLSYGALAGLAAAFMALGRDQVAYLGLLVLALIALGRIVQDDAPVRALRRALLPLIAGALVGLLVIAVPIGMTLLLADSSNRPAILYEEAARGSLHPALLLTALIPNLFGVDGPFLDYWGPPSPRWGETGLVLARNMGVLYMGALPFAVLLAAAFRGVLWAREVRVYTLCAALMLLYALGGFTPLFPSLFAILPGVDFFRRPADATFLVGALGALLAGYGVHRIWTGSFLRPGYPWGRAELSVILAAFAAAVGLGLAKGTLHLATWPLVKASLCLAAALAFLALLPSLASRRPRAALAALLLMLAADLAWNNGPNESTALPPSAYDMLRPESRDPLLVALRERLAPDGLDRVELTGLGFAWPNASLVHRLHNVLGYNPLRLGSYSVATGAEDHVALPDQRRFSPLMPSYRSPLADLLGLRWIATGVPVERIDPRLQPGDLVLVAETPSGFLYENPRALPRVLFATGVIPADQDALLRGGAWPQGFDPRRSVVLSEEMPSQAPRETQAALTVLSYGNTDVLIDVRTTQAGYLVLNDPHHPWWSAQIDGREVSILRANGIFRAVRVEPGAHRVRFVFRPFRGAWRDALRRWPFLAAFGAR